MGRWEAHHAVAIADGGKDTLDNLLTLCPACHAAVTRARSGYRATLVVTRAIPEQFTLDFRDPATRIPYCEFAVGS